MFYRLNETDGYIGLYYFLKQDFITTPSPFFLKVFQDIIYSWFQIIEVIVITTLSVIEELGIRTLFPQKHYIGGPVTISAPHPYMSHILGVIPWLISLQIYDFVARTLWFYH